MVVARCGQLTHKGGFCRNTRRACRAAHPEYRLRGERDCRSFAVFKRAVATYGLSEGASDVAQALWRTSLKGFYFKKDDSYCATIACCGYDVCDVPIILRPDAPEATVPLSVRKCEWNLLRVEAAQAAVPTRSPAPITSVAADIDQPDAGVMFDPLEHAEALCYEVPQLQKKKRRKVK